MANEVVKADEQAIKADIEKLKAAKDDLQAKGADLFVAEINNIEEKIKAKESQIAAVTTQTVEKAETDVSTWWDKYKNDIYNVLKIGSLVYIAIRLTM